MRITGLAIVAAAACSSSKSPSPAAIDAATITSNIDAPATMIDAPASGNDYDMDGPVPYTMQAMQLMNGSSTFNVTLYMPSTPGKHPLVALSCGTQQTAAGYDTYAKRLASYGIAMLLEDDPGVVTNTSDILPNAEYVIDTWIPSTLADSVDTTKIGLAGHSRGGAVSLLTAEHEVGKIAAWFGLDPVDNEFGQNPREYARTNMPSIGIPTTFLGAGVTSNCAPTADSYELLYPLAPSPSVLIVGVGAGHTQLEDPSGCSLCTICSPSGTADGAVVLAYATRYFTAFFARELLGDASVGPAFEGAGAAADIAAGRVTLMSK